MATKIEWTEATWNPACGCTKISDGCKNCYAEPMANRLKGAGVKGYENGFEFSMVPSRLNDPLKRKKPTLYFVGSMTDIFHGDMPSLYLSKILKVMRDTPRHTYQVLTKRADRMYNFLDWSIIPKNVWIGVTVENKKQGLPRIEHLRRLKATVKFLSIEPLLEDLGSLDLIDIDWVVVGGETGHNARPMKKEWVLNIKKLCEDQNVAFFFKQWGAYGEDGVKRDKKKNGHLIDGKEYREYPEFLINRMK